jgi:hypothetical protein
VFTKGNEEVPMASQFVVGLFESEGIARDARNRLHTEGLPPSRMSIVVLHDIASPPPASTKAELAALSVDPMVRGDVEHTFAEYIRNGETAVIVECPTLVDAQFTIETMTLYDPLAIEALEKRPAAG